MKEYFNLKLIKGLLADKFGNDVITFYFSGICFLIGLSLTALVSFGDIIKRCCFKKNTSTDEHDINNNKLANDSELNANLLKNKSEISA